MFAVIMNGWTDAGPSTHQMGVYAHYEDPQSTNEGKCILLAFAPPLG